MYEFYMDGVRLPVTPSALTIKIANQNKTINLINEGQVNVLKTPGLSKISFSALLPNREYPFACYPNGYQPAQYYMSKLESLKTACKSFEFSVIRIDDSGEQLMSAQPMTVSLESYELAEDAGSYGVDVMAKIELLQYAPYHTKSSSRRARAVPARRKPPSHKSATPRLHRQARRTPSSPVIRCGTLPG